MARPRESRIQIVPLADEREPLRLELHLTHAKCCRDVSVGSVGAKIADDSPILRLDRGGDRGDTFLVERRIRELKWLERYLATPAVESVPAGARPHDAQPALAAIATRVRYGARA